MKNAAVKKQTLYASHDLALVAYLLCRGYELVEVHRGNGNRVEFVVGGGAGVPIEQEKTSFWNSQTSVDAQTYFNALRRLKNQIYAS